MAAFLGLVALVPILMLGLPRVPTDKLILPLLMFEFVALGGLVYVLFYSPKETRVVIAAKPLQISLTRVCLFSQDQLVMHVATAQRLEFALFHPYRSAFDVVEMRLYSAASEYETLTSTNNRMYSWQGRKIYAALQAFFVVTPCSCRWNG